MADKRRPIAIYTKAWLSSGTGLFAQELAVGIVQAGGEAVFVAPPAQNQKFEEPVIGLRRIRTRRERVGGSKPARVLASTMRVASSVIGLACARRSARTFVVTIPDPLVFAIPMLLALRASGARIIYVVHDALPHAWRLPARLRWLETCSYAVAYRLAHALVVPSAAARETLCTAYDLGGKAVETIEHGVFVMAHPAPATGAGRLLAFGTLRRNKGLREAIEGVVAAVAAGANVSLIIAGMPDTVEPDYWVSCETLARAHAGVVALEVGYVSDDRLRELIAECDAFVLPYRNFNSQSGVAILATSNARAVIASAAGGLGDLMRDGMAGVEVASPVDGPAVAAAIRSFADTPIEVWNTRAFDYLNRTLEIRAWSVIGGHYLNLATRLEDPIATPPSAATETASAS